MVSPTNYHHAASSPEGRKLLAGHLVLWEAIEKKRVFYHLSPFTVAEVATVLNYKVSHQSAKRFLKKMRKINLTVIPLPVALLERYNLDLVFSFDKVYEENGFKTV